MPERSPTRLYALAFGAGLTLAGLIGFLYSFDFTTGEDALGLSDDLLGIFKVNGWHNLLHLTTGLAGLAAAASTGAARLYAAGFGIAYLGLGVIGVALGPPEVLASAVPIDGADNLLHLGIGALGLAAYVAERRAAIP